MDEAPLLALDRLRRTPEKVLARAAVQELVRRDVLRLQPLPGKRWGNRSTVPGLTDGPGPVPTGALLRLVTQVARSAPVRVVDARAVRDLRLVAQRLAGRGYALQDAALADLAAAGLVEPSVRKVLGLVPRRTWRRTPAGDAALREAHPRREARWGAELDAGFDDGFDSAFDGGFDGGGDGGGD